MNIVIWWQSLPESVQGTVFAFVVLSYLLMALALGFTFLARFFFPKWTPDEG